MKEEQVTKILEGMDTLGNVCYEAAVANGWWSNFDGTPKERNKGELLMLMVSELAEAMEGERKNLMDTHLTYRKMVEVEFADTIIRMMDYARHFGYDVGGAIIDKIRYNAERADHKLENRAKAGGKKF